MRSCRTGLETNENYLQHFDPVFHGRDRIGRQVKRFFTSGYLEGGRAVGSGYPAQIIDSDFPLWFPRYIVLERKKRKR